MEVKKNKRADLNTRSGLYFAFGLALALFLTWQALELKIDISEKEVFIPLSEEELIQEDIPITKEIKTLPLPPPAAAPDVIEIVENTEEVVETVIESTETSQDEIIEDVVEVEDVEVVEEEVIEEVPFAIIESAPVFPGCEKLSKAMQRDCFNKKIQEHVTKNFRYPPTAQELNIQGKVYVTFVIDNDGNITNIRTRGPDKSLEKEAKRIISLLPKMIPGKQRGRAVRVPYSIPINFKLA